MRSWNSINLGSMGIPYSLKTNSKRSKKNMMVGTHDGWKNMMVKKKSPLKIKGCWYILRRSNGPSNRVVWLLITALTLYFPSSMVNLKVRSREKMFHVTFVTRAKVSWTFKQIRQRNAMPQPPQCMVHLDLSTFWLLWMVNVGYLYHTWSLWDDGMFPKVPR